MLYRLAAPSDLRTLARMRWDFRAEGGEVPIEDAAAFEARYLREVGAAMGGRRLTYWIAEDEHTVAAQMAVVRVSGIPRPSRASDQWGYLTDCYTRPQWRGRGVGSALLEHVQRWAAAEDLELLLVSPSDESRPFYARAGFGEASGFAELTLREF